MSERKIAIGIIIAFLVLYFYAPVPKGKVTMTMDGRPIGTDI